VSPIPPRLELDHICRDYAGRLVVDELSLTLQAGEVACLLGPSGCGKSTTLRIAAGVEEQSDGIIRIDGKIVSGEGMHMPPEERGVGMMFQDFALFPFWRGTAAGCFDPRTCSQAEHRADGRAVLRP